MPGLFLERKAKQKLIEYFLVIFIFFLLILSSRKFQHEKLFFFFFLEFIRWKYMKFLIKMIKENLIYEDLLVEGVGFRFLGSTNSIASKLRSFLYHNAMLSVSLSLKAFLSASRTRFWMMST